MRGEDVARSGSRFSRDSSSATLFSRRRVFSMRASTWRSCSGVQGFGRSSNAPRRIASTAVSMEANAVTTTTAARGETLRASVRTSSPLSSLSFKSRRMTSNESRRSSCSASSPVEAEEESCPSASKASENARRMFFSSSTMRTRIVAMRGFRISDAASSRGNRDERGRAPAPPGLVPPAQVLEGEVNDGRGVKRQRLGKDKAADHRDPQGLPQLRTRAHSNRQRDGAEESRRRRHHDGAEPDDARLVDGFLGGQVFLALGFEGEVDHHDGVLLHDAHEENDADEGDQRKLAPRQHEGQQRADARGGKRQKNGDRVDEALVENPEHDVDGKERGDEQQGHGGKRGLEDLGGALEAAEDVARHPQLARGVGDEFRRLAEGDARREIERKRDGGKLSLVIHRQEGVASLELRDRREGDLPARGGTDENLAERRGLELVSGVRFQDDVVLVVALVKDGDLPLAECVIQGVVHRLHREAQARGGVAIHDHIGLQAARLLVARDILQLRDALQLFQKAGRPLVQLVEVPALQRVEILRLAGTSPHTDILDRLQEEVYPFDVGELAPQPADDLLRGRPLALGDGL